MSHPVTLLNIKPVTLLPGGAACIAEVVTQSGTHVTSLHLGRVARDWRTFCRLWLGRTSRHCIWDARHVTASGPSCTRLADFLSPLAGTYVTSLHLGRVARDWRTFCRLWLGRCRATRPRVPVCPPPGLATLALSVPAPLMQFSLLPVTTRPARVTQADESPDSHRPVIRSTLPEPTIRHQCPFPVHASRCADQDVTNTPSVSFSCPPQSVF